MAMVIGVSAGILTAGLCPLALVIAYGINGSFPDDFARVCGFYFAVAILPVVACAILKLKPGAERHSPEWSVLVTVPLSVYLNFFLCGSFWMFGAPHVVVLVASAVMSACLSAIVSCQAAKLSLGRAESDSPK